MLLFLNRCYIIGLQINKRVVFAILGAHWCRKGGSVFMLVSEWLGWMLQVNDKKKEVAGRPSSPCYLPAISFSKRSRSFSLYFYLSKDSYISKVNFFYDGGELLPTLVSDEGWLADKGVSDESWFADEGRGADASRLADEEMCKSLALFLISKFFSFNLTILKKAIHHKGKLYLSPKVASINSHFFGVKLSRTRSSGQLAKDELVGKELLGFIKGDKYLMEFVTFSASHFDLSFFDDFFSSLKYKASLNGFSVRKPVAFSAFRNLVLDFQ